RPQARRGDAETKQDEHRRELPERYRGRPRAGHPVPPTGSLQDLQILEQRAQIALPLRGLRILKGPRIIVPPVRVSAQRGIAVGYLRRLQAHWERIVSVPAAIEDAAALDQVDQFGKRQDAAIMQIRRSPPHTVERLI